MSTNIGKWQNTKPFSKDLLIHLYSNFLFGFYLELAATWIQWFSVISLYLKIYILHYNIYKIILWFHKKCQWAKIWFVCRYQQITESSCHHVISRSWNNHVISGLQNHHIIRSPDYQIMESSCHHVISRSSNLRVIMLSEDDGIIMSSCYLRYLLVQYHFT